MKILHFPDIVYQILGGLWPLCQQESEDDSLVHLSAEVLPRPPAAWVPTMCAG